MSNIIKIGLRLFIITLVSALSLGLTNLATQEPIRMQHIKAANEARQGALPQAEEFIEMEIEEGSSRLDGSRIVEINRGKSEGELIGYTFKVYTKGFGGDIEIMVGVNIEGHIEAIQIGQHEETPGLGAKIVEESFISQYHGKDTDTSIGVSKTQSGVQEVQAITGATITTDSITRGVNLASQYYKEVLQNGGRSR